MWGRIFDKDNGSTDYSTTVTVSNVAPSPTITGVPAGNTSPQETPITLLANPNDPGLLDTFTYAWSVTKDAIAYTLPGGTITNAASFTFTPAVPGSYVASVTVQDDDGGSGSASAGIAVTAVTYQVTSFTSNPSGFDVQLSGPANVGVLNLYSGESTSGALPDLTLVGQSTGPVSGSLIWDASTNTAHFVKTGGLLAADNYTLTLFSRGDGWKDAGGQLLDGNADGTAGDDYTHTFAIAAPTGAVLSLPDFARGPNQPVNLPATASGIPLRISDAAGLRSLSVELDYDPAMLSPSGATLASGMPGDWTIGTSSPGAGRLTITASGTTALLSGQRELLRIAAMVPSGATYGASQVLRLTAVQLNGGTISATADQAVQQVAYVGDATGSQDYSGADASLVSRIVVGLDGGLDAFPRTDPLILSDVTGDGTISGLDAAYVAQIRRAQPAGDSRPADRQGRAGLGIRACAGRSVGHAGQCHGWPGRQH